MKPTSEVVHPLLLQEQEYIQELYLINKNHPEFELQEMGLIFVELQKFKPSNYAHKKLKELWLKFLTEIKDNTTDSLPL